MTSQSIDSFPPLWRALGLSVAVGFTGLGSYAMFMPITAASQVGLRSQLSGSTTQESDRYTRRAMAWIGARDLSIATALIWLYVERKPADMGRVILSSMFFCAVDIFYVWQAREDWVAISMAGGAACYAWVAWNLLNL